MNYNTEQVIITYSIITGITDRKKILKTLSKSMVFKGLIQGSPALLYEGYVSNFLDIIEDLKGMKDCPEEVMKITEEMVDISERARYNKYAHRKICFRLPLRLKITISKILARKKLSKKEAKRIGRLACIEKIGYDFCMEHFDNSTFGWGMEERNIMGCFAGTSDKPDEEVKGGPIRLTSGPEGEWPYYAYCHVNMKTREVKFIKYKTPDGEIMMQGSTSKDET